MKYELTEGLYRVTDFDEARQQCRNFIEETLMYDATDAKQIKKARAAIRKKKDEVAALRKEAVRALSAFIVPQCKELEAMLQEADEKLKAVLDKDKAEEPEPTTITCKVYDSETAQKAVDFLKGLGLTVTVK